MKCVQFSDETKAEVIAVFGCVQDEEEYPNQGLLEEDDPLLVEFVSKFQFQ
ncbi:hypothetical protein V8U11_06800 [Pseudomonas chlororaphis]|uniref:hypothetical protein n=1 Tax=Pseudomonas chlororaphis TaxID=587753 RepID=UPI0030D5BAAC